MPDIITFDVRRGPERVWVAEADVEYWLDFFHRQGNAACRWRDYLSWGGFFPPHPESVGDVLFYPPTRSRRFSAR